MNLHMLHCKLVGRDETPHRCIYRVAACEVLPATSQLRLIKVKVQLVRLIGRAGVGPPAKQSVGFTAVQRAWELARCVEVFFKGSGDRCRSLSHGKPASGTMLTTRTIRRCQRRPMCTAA